MRVRGYVTALIPNVDTAYQTSRQHSLENQNMKQNLMKMAGLPNPSVFEVYDSRFMSLPVCSNRVFNNRL